MSLPVVLLVLDDADLGALLSNFLRRSGFDPMLLKTVAEALEHRTSPKPAVVVASQIS